MDGVAVDAHGHAEQSRGERQTAYFELEMLRVRLGPGIVGAARARPLRRSSSR